MSDESVRLRERLEEAYYEDETGLVGVQDYAKARTLSGLQLVKAYFDVLEEKEGWRDSQHHTEDMLYALAEELSACHSTVNKSSGEWIKWAREKVEEVRKCQSQK